MKTHIFFASLASARANRLMPGATTETRLGGAAADRVTPSPAALKRMSQVGLAPPGAGHLSI